jgi:hypothetical protein
LISNRPVARRLDTSQPLAVAALLSIALILAVTLGIRPFEGGGVGISAPHIPCLDAHDCWSRVVEIDLSWRLNLAMFVPAGLFLTLATRRPVYALGGLIALSASIELAQGIFGLGAADPGDLVANSLGAMVGTVIGTIAWRIPRRRSDESRRAWSPRRLVLPVLAAGAIAASAWLGLAFAADARRESLANDVRHAFAGTSSAYVASQLATPGGAERLFSATGTRPSYLGQIGESDTYEARYSTQFFGFDRCVFARWTLERFSLTLGSGEECTVFRDRPPV